MKSTLMAASALFLLAALWMQPAQAQQKNDPKRETLSGSLNASTYGNDGNGETNINYVEGGHQYKIRMNGNKILEMSLDGRTVPAEDYSKYDALVKKIMAQLERDREQARKDREQAERDREQADKDRLQARKDREQADRDREQANEDRKKAINDRAQADRDREQAKKDRAQADLDRVQASRDRKQAEEDRKLINDLIAELVTDKLVASSEALTSLELDDTTLVVNGTAQPAKVQAHYKEKYLKGQHHQLTYRNSGGSRNTSVK